MASFGHLDTQENTRVFSFIGPTQCCCEVSADIYFKNGHSIVNESKQDPTTV